MAKTMRLRGFSATGLILLAGGVVLGLVALEANTEPSAFQLGVATHETRTQWSGAPELPASEIPAETETPLPGPPTRSSFMATWDKVNGATAYLLDVATDDSFSSYVDGYRGLNVGDVAGRVVTGLNPGTTYYYRVRSYDAGGRGSYSVVQSATTAIPTGLIIHPTFDSSITGNPNAAAIEAMINRAISIYESLFSDPITIEIRFRYATTAPDGTPLPQGTVSRSDSVVYQIPWNTYISALRADARTNNDALANASLPANALSGNVKPKSSAGRAVALNTPHAMFADGTVGNGGPYDGIVTINSALQFQFTRPTSAGNIDAQRSTEHEMDEVIGFGSRLGQGGGDLWPQDLFSWRSPGVRNITTSGARYFSINSGATNIVSFNQDPDGDFGDWLSAACPQAHPYVQNAFGCTGQSSDISATSPEGINLDVIGYDLVNGPPPSPTDFDFNNDGHPDYLLYNSSAQQTGIEYLNNNVPIGAAFGPVLPAGWSVVAVADFNRDGHPDWLLFNPATLHTVIWYMNNNVHIGGNSGPTLPGGWSVVATADFNSDGHPDYLLFNAGTHGTTIWYMNNNVHIGGNPGPTLPAGWIVVGAADFNSNGKPDYVLYNSSNRQTAIWYLNNNVLVGSAFGPTLPAGWSLVAP